MNALTPIEQRIVVFYDDELTAVVVDENGREAEVAEQLICYQRKCYQILANAFLPPPKTVEPETSDSDDWMTISPETLANLQQIRETGRAIAQWADEQLRIQNNNRRQKRPLWRSL